MINRVSLIFTWLALLLVAGFVADGKSQALAEQRAGSSHAVAERGRSNEDKKATKQKYAGAVESDPQEKTANHENSLGRPLLKNVLLDQKAIWTSPSRVRLRDATWLVPLGGLTAGLFTTDRDTIRHLSNSSNRLDRSRKFSNFGAATLVGAAGGLYLWGKATQDEHKRETGLLSGEALINSLVVSNALKFAAGRDRPLENWGRGQFGRGGRSFPSDHAAAVWSVAGVIAHEYPGPLTKLLAYGLASAVSASRLTSKEHFPSDVLVGSAIGWFVGEHVYRAHHAPELGGGSWANLSDVKDKESRRQPKNMGSPYVPLDSWIYPALERLAALGYVQTAFLGLRPWTRLECARLIDEAADRLRGEDSDPPEPNRLYRALEKEFADDLKLLGGSRNVSARLESLYIRFTGIAGAPLRDGYHFGQTIINDYGRPYAEGANAVAGFSGRATAGRFAVYVRGEYQHAPAAPALSDQVRNVVAAVDDLPVAPATPFPSTNRFRLLDTYVAMNLENWQISFGKQSLWWGPGPSGPLMFSDNAEPVTMLQINRVSPFKLPSILGWLGPLRVDFFLGQLAGHQFLFGPSGLVGQFGRLLDPQPFIHGQKISFKPTPNFEFSVSRTVIFGGPGLPFNWHTFLSSMFSTGNAPVRSSSKPGDRRSGIDFSYRIPGLRKWLTFYGDAFTEDEFSPIGYIDRSAARAGIYISQMPGLSKLDFRAEGVYTDLPPGGALGGGIFYFNIRYRNGYENWGNILGSWIGRQGQGAQVWTTYWLSPRNKLQVSYRHQKVSQRFIPRGGTLSDVAVHADFWVRSDLSLSSLVQYELWNFPVLATRAQPNITSSLQLTFWPRWHKN